MAASKAKLEAMDSEDKLRIMLEESKNRVESYMFTVKNKLVDNEEELSTVSTDEQREECRKLAVDTELWLEEDGYSADYPTMEDKYAELSGPFEKILLRLREKTARPETIAKVEEILVKAESRLEKWITSMPQITQEEREKVVKRIESIRANVTAMEEAQAAKEPHEDPAYLSIELVEKLKPLDSMMQRLSKKPKSKPKKQTTTTTGTDNSNSTNKTTTTGDNETDTSDDAESSSTPATEDDTTTTGDAAEEEEDVKEEDADTTADSTEGMEEKETDDEL